MENVSETECAIILHQLFFGDRGVQRNVCGNTYSNVRRLHVSTMTPQHATRDPTTQQQGWRFGLVPWVPAGHPQCTGAWFAQKAVDGPIPPQRLTNPLLAVRERQCDDSRMRVDCAWTVAVLGPDESSRVDLATRDLDVWVNAEVAEIRV